MTRRGGAVMAAGGFTSFSEQAQSFQVAQPLTQFARLVWSARISPNWWSQVCSLLIN